MKSFIINSNDAGQRLDKFITKSTSAMAQSLVYKYLRQKRIKVNRKKCDASYRLEPGDIVEMYIPDEFFAEGENAFLQLTPHVNVVYEDENILLANKPTGQSCQPDSDQREATLIDNIKAYLYRNGFYNPSAEASFAPSLCNRIDRNTAGLVICAKNAIALREINELIRNHKVIKKYYALLHGILPKKHDTITHFLRKDSETNMVSVFTSPRPGALTAITEYTSLAYFSEKDITLAELELHTGRTHQIRAQLAFIGNPLVGDGKYGVNRNDRRDGYRFQVLFSHSLEFVIEDRDSTLFYLNGRLFEAEPDSRFDGFLKN